MQVARFCTTPVKGLALSHPDSIELTATGAAGDRDFFLIGDDDRLVSITATGSLVELAADWSPGDDRLTIRSRDGSEWTGELRPGRRVSVDFWRARDVAGHVLDGPWSDLLSERAGRRVHLVQAETAGDGSDIEPVTLLGQASVAELARRSGLESVDARRFRMLIEFAEGEPHVEDTWHGQTLEVGEALLRVGGPVPRCAATTRDPDSGTRDLPVVRMIRDYRGVTADGVGFGVYADVLRPGTVRVGDRLVLG
jgi:uncharacterized protein YcbX